MKNDALIIFIKNPVKGKVKTRLAKTIGEEKALEIYKQLLQITKTVALQYDCTRYLFYSTVVDIADDWHNDHFLKHQQIGDDLGERMQHAFEFVYKLGHQKAVIIGSDCPKLDNSIIEKAFFLLQENEVVIGPSEDGGYYLLGMQQLMPELFAGMPWSKDHLFNTTINVLAQEKRTYQLLPVLNDIDTEVDWIEYLK